MPREYESPHNASRIERIKVYVEHDNKRKAINALQKSSILVLSELLKTPNTIKALSAAVAILKLTAQLTPKRTKKQYHRAVNLYREISSEANNYVRDLEKARKQEQEQAVNGNDET